MGHFNNDCLPVARAALDSDQVFINCATFVFLSIQQPLWGLPMQYKDVMEKGANSRYLFGAKRGGFEHVKQNVSTLRKAANLAHGNGDLDTLIMAFLQVPCLGLAKASFLAQMTTGQGACLDVHNLRLLGLGPSALTLNKKLLPVTQLKKVQAYNTIWQAQGDSAHWWNTWCNNLANSPRNRFTTGEQVSQIHRLPLAA